MILLSAFLAGLLLICVLEILVLIFGAMGATLPAGVIDLFLKLKALILNLFHDLK